LLRVGADINASYGTIASLLNDSPDDHGLRNKHDILIDRALRINGEINGSIAVSEKRHRRVTARQA
jgi:hypothetical protein